MPFYLSGKKIVSSMPNAGWMTAGYFPCRMRLIIIAFSKRHGKPLRRGAGCSSH